MGPGDANFGEELEGSSVSRSETERSGGASPKFAASSVGGLASGGAAPDPEVTDKPKRRRFTVEYKLSLLKKADAYRHQPGKVGAPLATQQRSDLSRLVTVGICLLEQREFVLHREPATFRLVRHLRVGCRSAGGQATNRRRREFWRGPSATFSLTT